MGTIRLLDCTLRDGAYIVDGNFGSNAIRGIIKRLGEAHIEIIECGWLKDKPHIEGSTYFHLPSDAIRYLGEKKEDAIYSVMIDWDRYDLGQLPDYDGNSIDAIRVVFPYNHYKEAIPLGETIKEKGYRLFFQAANTLAYSEEALIDMIEEINRVKPDGLSVVDTFGAMYEEDLIKIVHTVNKHLDPSVSLGLHSHNNLQQSFSLAMGYVRMMQGCDRDIIVDSSLSGMGRGAGNAPTELVANYLNRFCGKNYDINTIVDVIDVYMSYFEKNYTWGYSTAYFLSGMFCSHVNNIAYLTQKHKVRNKDIKQILEALPADKRIVYDYDLLEEKYVEHQQCNVEDELVYDRLRERMRGKKVLIIAPGLNALKEKDRVDAVAAQNDVVTIGVNAGTEGFHYDYLFFTNSLRLSYALEANRDILNKTELILTSNLMNSMKEEGDWVNGKAQYINYTDLIKRNWVHFDNSVVMCLRMLDRLGVREVYVAGFDGYSGDKMYADPVLHANLAADEIKAINQDITDMLIDFQAHKTSVRTVSLVTSSCFSGCLGTGTATACGEG